MTRTMHPIALALVVATTTPPIARAQELGGTPVARIASTATWSSPTVSFAESLGPSSRHQPGSSGPLFAGPTLARATVTLPLITVLRAPATRYDLVAPKGGRKAEGTTLMIIGGAALVSGLIIGGNGSGAAGALIAVAGVGVGAYGVYLYVN